VPRLRALVVLPTRDLAAQVFKVFATLAPAVGLRVGLAAAAAPLAAEAAVLATAGFPGLGSDAGDAARAAGGVGFAEDAMLAGQQPGLGLGQGCGGGGGVDVLVATPGRLMAHLRGTPGVTLEHLRFLARARAARAEGLSSAALLEELAGCEHLGHAPAFEHLSASLCGPVPLPIFDLKEVR
jgi:ATP-dependent RNA helicase DDX51/DBP6